MRAAVRNQHGERAGQFMVAVCQPGAIATCAPGRPSVNCPNKKCWRVVAVRGIGPQFPWPASPRRGGAGRDSRRTSVSATAGQAQDERGQAERLGIKPGQVVQEIGYDDDCDEQLRGAITRVDGVELVDEDYDDVVDVVLLWWRDGDGDLVDALVDALTPLADGGYIWLLTPKAGR